MGILVVLCVFVVLYHYFRIPGDVRQRLTASQKVKTFFTMPILGRKARTEFLERKRLGVPDPAGNFAYGKALLAIIVLGLVFWGIVGGIAAHVAAVPHSPQPASRPQSETPVKDDFNEQRIALGKESDKLDAEIDAAMSGGQVKTPQQAAVTLKAYENYCVAEEDLYSRQEALYAREHKTVGPVLIEQHEATTQVCKAGEDVFRYLADPSHKLRTVDGHVEIVGPDAYNQKLLALDAAGARLNKANAALEAFNKVGTRENQ
jgi:hypothetical protein